VATLSALQAGQELAGMQEWPLRSYLELRALPVSVRSARLHARTTLGEWQLGAFAETVELLVSEITTNAVRASASSARQPRGKGPAARALPVRFWLTSDRHHVLIQVWDGDNRQPQPQNPGPDAECGRGLLLVETLSTQWGCYTPDGQGGKIVWALCAQ
jgi:Histidine kinase-like ATPase domain